MKILLFIVLLGILLVIIQRLTRAPRAASGARQARGEAGRIDAAQARAILGLEDTPLSRDAIIAAHRRLMQHIHPDKGGSALLAQQLNEAKRVLLTDL